MMALQIFPRNYQMSDRRKGNIKQILTQQRTMATYDPEKHSVQRINDFLCIVSGVTV